MIEKIILPRILLFALCIIFCSDVLADGQYRNTGDCWSKSSKRLFKKEFVSLFEGHFNSSDVNIPPLVSAIALSKMKINAVNFGVSSFDSNTGNYTCSVSVGAVFDTNNFGNVAVANTEVSFKLLMHEDGIHLNITELDIYPFFESFSYSMKSIGINYEVYRAD